MPNVTQTIPNYLGGVSKQPDTKKLPGQLTDCINGYPDPTFGLTKRPGFKFIKNLGSENTYSNAKWFYIHRDGDEKYIGCIKSTSIYIWNIVTGTAATITNNGTGYLTGAKPQDYDVLTVQDTTIVTNKLITVGAQAAPSFTANKVGTVHLKTVSNSVVYKVVVNNSNATYTSDSSATADEILTGLKSAIDGLSVSGLTVTKLDSTLELSCNSAFTLTGVGGTDNLHLTTFQNQVANVAQLPNQSVNNRVVKIINSANTAADVSYSKFVADNGTSGNGYWSEDIAPDVSPGLNSATMPHELVNTATNTFTFRPLTWTGRLVGDDTTNSHPSFVGKTIQQAFFHSSRLGFLTEDNVSMSQANKFYDFYHISSLTQVASDPVDLSTSSIRPTLLTGVLPTAQGLILFSKNQQFLMYAPNGIFTPTDTIIRGISNFEMDINIDPVDNGTSIVFVSKTPSYTRVYEMATAGQEMNPVVVDIGRIVSEWIPDTVTELLSSPQNSFIALYGPTKSDIYFYRTHNDGQQRVMQSWFRWSLPGVVQTISVDEDVLYSVTMQGGIYTLISASLNQTPEETILVNSLGEKINPCVDLYTNASSVKYKGIDDFTITAGGNSYTSAPTVTITPIQLFEDVNITTASSGGTNGTYTNIATTGGSGSGLTVDVEIEDGTATAVTVNASGTGYENLDTITIAKANIGNTAADVVGTLIKQGYGATATATVSGGAVTGITLTACGSGYVHGATVSFSGGGGVAAAATATVYDGSKCYLPYTDTTTLDPVLVVGSDSSDLTNPTFVESGFTVTPTQSSDDIGSYFGVTQKDLTTSASKVIVGYKYTYDVVLPNTYFRLDPQGFNSDYTSSLTVSRYKFSTGLSGVVAFKLQRKGTADYTDVTAVPEANFYLANDVPLDDQLVVNVPIHQKNDNFTLRVYSDSPFPVSLTSMMWEGYYSPRFYRRT